MILLDELQTTLNSFPKAKCYWVAYSGGCDSHVLLHTLYSLSQLKSDTLRIAAVHVDHGLHTSAKTWAEHCKQVCADLKIEFKLLKVNAVAESGQSPEAVARDARYKAISEFITQDDVLLVAHHQEDQAETLLLQLIRGAGPRGLSAMPKSKLLAGNRVLRPFLNMTQKLILEYAQQHNLKWIDDPSNTDTRYDRNRIRHEVMPVMKQRWPSLSKTLSRVTQYQAEAAECLRELAELDWSKIKSSQNDSGLSILKLSQLSLARQKNLCRYWIEQKNSFDAIDSVHLDRIFNEVIPAAVDSQPKVKWQNTQVCRYRGILYVMLAERVDEPEKFQTWQISKSIELTQQRLSSQKTPGAGIKQSLISNGELDIRYRQGGERCQPIGRSNHHSLKKLFQ
ncbi:MAG: tRNA lysidine(34) synthetase TilS, partial [Gammaproteobacteria bacterium]